MQINEETKRQIIEDIISKASNNRDRQALVRPSEYGFERTTEGEKAFLAFIQKFVNCESVEIFAKDLVEIILEKGN